MRPRDANEAHSEASDGGSEKQYADVRQIHQAIRLYAALLASASAGICNSIL